MFFSFLKGLVRAVALNENRDMHQRPYEKIIAWQEAYALCLSIYKTTLSFPSSEKFALVSQMRRSAYSGPFTIAEGNAKRTKPDKRRFLEIGMGSIEELHCQLRLALDLRYISAEIFAKLDDHTQRVSYLLYRLHQSLI